MRGGWWVVCLALSSSACGEDRVELGRDVERLRVVLADDRVTRALEDVDRIADATPVRAAEQLRMAVLPAARASVESLRGCKVVTDTGHRLRARAVEVTSERVQALELYQGALADVPVSDEKLVEALHAQRIASQHTLALHDEVDNVFRELQH